MVMLVSLEQAKLHLRADTGDGDSDILLKIQAASAIVLNYIKHDGAEFIDSSGQVITDSSGNPIGVPADIQAAVLLMLGYLYKDRDGDPNREYELGYLPKPVMALVYWRRRLTLK